MIGALIAFELFKDHYDIVILDKDVPGYGSSDANIGIIQYNSDESLYEMIEVNQNRIMLSKEIIENR